jgi:hypothetical protein
MSKLDKAFYLFPSCSHEKKVVYVHGCHVHGVLRSKLDKAFYLFPSCSHEKKVVYVHGCHVHGVLMSKLDKAFYLFPSCSHEKKVVYVHGCHVHGVLVLVCSPKVWEHVKACSHTHAAAALPWENPLKQEPPLQTKHDQMWS